jgi:hypothetical protein
MTPTHLGKRSKLGNIGGSVESWGIGEEKKSFEEGNTDPCHRSLVGSINSTVQIEDNGVELDDDRFSKFAELPDELKSIRDTIFDSQEELLNKLEELECSDLRVVLDDKGKAYLFMPSHNHNDATSFILNSFTVWAANWKGFATGEHNIPVDQSIDIEPNPKRQCKLREPDISFWGFPKCERDDNELSPKPAHPPVMRPKVNPDVVIQFSWRNTKGYEFEALNDIMVRSESSDSSTPPSVGYLVKVRFSPQPGFDIYKVPHRATVDDAEKNINGASKLTYNWGGPDVVIKITAVDLGIQVPATGIWDCFVGTLRLLWNAFTKKHASNAARRKLWCQQIRFYHCLPERSSFNSSNVHA